jgi:hypothetical protein
VKKINKSVLRKGDIILTTSIKIESRVIKVATFSDISHAMLYVSNGSVMDSTSEGVQARNVEKIFYPDSCAIHILRLKSMLDDIEIDKVIKYIRERTGAPYTTKESIVSVFNIGNGSEDQFCSRLVARAFASIGVNLVKNPDYCTPANLKRSILLKFIEPPSVSISDKEINEIEGHGDSTKGMRIATTSLLDLARNIHSDIKNINDIPKISIEHPEHDSSLAQALKTSGYLDHWQEEITNYSWRYNPQEIVQFYHSLSEPEELLDYCQQTLSDEKMGSFKHWKTSLDELNELNRRYPRETLNALISLYIKLNFYHELRLKSANIIIKVYGGISA